MKLHKQQGITLVVGLIMLIVLTLLVVSAVRFSSTNLRIAGNMQAQTEAAAAAQQGIENVLGTDFAKAPASATVAVDLNNDGVTDYIAKVDVPVCNSITPLSGADGNPSIADDQSLFSSGTSDNSGIINSAGNSTGSTSFIQKQKWDLKVRVTDNKTGADLTQHQGVAVRVLTGSAC